MKTVETFLVLIVFH